MGTSSSDEAWVATADIFSGFSNPAWVVDHRVADKLMDLWAGMEQSPPVAPISPVLGYQGVYLRGPQDRVWHAYSGVVTLTENGVDEARQDRERKFEKILLSSAPRELLPHSFLDDFAGPKEWT